MEEQVQNPVPTEPITENRQPITGSFPWLKLAGVAFFALVILNLGLAYFVFYAKPKSSLPKELVGTEDNQGFLLTKPDQTISRNGYSITFSNPRYEHLDAQSFFRVDVALVNERIQPSIKIIANCDIEENGVVVQEGAGVSVESGDSKDVYPGGTGSWTALMILKNKTQKVSSCIYSPEGLFDPNQTIRVVF